MNSRLLPLPFDIDNGCRGLALREKDEEKVLGKVEQWSVLKTWRICLGVGCKKQFVFWYVKSFIKAFCKLYESFLLALKKTLRKSWNKFLESICFLTS